MDWDVTKKPKVAKDDFTDLDVRVTALNFAQVANQHPDGMPSAVLSDARGIYLFLSGKDPVVDGVNGTLDQSKVKDAGIISFDEWLREKDMSV